MLIIIIVIMLIVRVITIVILVMFLLLDRVYDKGWKKRRLLPKTSYKPKVF